MNRYDSYKDSGVEWIGEIPSHWEVKPLKNVSGYNLNSLGNSTNPDYELDYLEISDVNSNGKIGNPTHYQFSKSPSRCRRIVRKNDVLISTVRTYLKSIGFIEDEVSDLICSTGFCVVSPKDNVIPKLLFYLIRSEWFVSEVISKSEGVSYPSIQSEKLMGFKVVLPHISEQQQIVSFLDDKTQKIDSLIQQKEKKIELLKEKRTSLINYVVTKGLDSNVEMKDSGVEWIGEIPNGWTILKMSYILEGITDGTHGTHERVDEGELFLSSKNVTNKGIFIGENESQITTEEHEKIVKKGYPVKGDILITVVGSIGRSCVYEYDYPISFQRSVCFLRLRKTINEYFMNFLINSDVIQFQLLKNTKKSTQGGIYMNDLKRFDIILPSLSEQQQIVEYLDKQTDEIETLIQLEQKKIDTLKEYRQSLISEVVTGKIRVCKEDTSLSLNSQIV